MSARQPVIMWADSPHSQARFSSNQSENVSAMLTNLKASKRVITLVIPVTPLAADHHLFRVRLTLVAPLERFVTLSPS